ncbi:MAG: hypothetical protein AB4911_13475 [Oscillochloridaceae bacterium umkhey_bin13]
MCSSVPSSCEELHRLYVEQHLSLSAVARQVGCSPPTVAVRLRRCGIAIRSGRFVAHHLPRELIEQLYLIEALPMTEIATRLGVSIGTVHNRRRAYGIPTRSRCRAKQANVSASQPPQTIVSENSLHF